MRSRLRACVSISAAVALCGCNTYSQLAIQHHLQLLEERNQLNAIKRALQDSPDLKAGSVAEVFLSTSAINQVLAGADGREFALPRSPKTLIRVGSIRTAFGNGYPRLAIAATARHGSAEVNLRIEAYLQAVVNTADLDTALMHIRIIDVVPDVKWGPFQFRIRGIVKDVLSAKVHEYQSRFPSFTVPLRHEFKIDEPGGTKDEVLPIGGARVPVQVTKPAIQDAPGVRAKRIVFLSDGIHIFLAM